MTVIYEPGAKIVVENPNGETENYPVSLFDADQICSGLTFYNQDGDLVQGTRNCDGSTSEGTDSNLKAENIKAGVSIGAVTGTMLSRPDDCSNDGETDCVATTSYPAVVLANVSPGVVKAGTTIAGILGEYPNASYPLPGAGATADLNDATFAAQIKSTTAFEYWDSAGVRRTGVGDADLADVTLIKSGTDIFGTTGNYGPPCTTDAQQNCVTTGNFKAVDTTTFTVWDIRRGKTIGGRAGSITFQKSNARLNVFNRTLGTGANNSTTTADLYDSIDDFGNDVAMPSTVIGPYLNLSGSTWITDTASGTPCNFMAAGDCVQIDQNSGMSWLKDDGTLRTWEDAITFCEGLTYGTYTDWRLPTQKEMLQAYVDKIFGTLFVLNLQKGAGVGEYWTSTTDSTSTGANAWLVTLYSGNTVPADKTVSKGVICTRP